MGREEIQVISQLSSIECPENLFLQRAREYLQLEFGVKNPAIDPVYKHAFLHVARWWSPDRTESEFDWIVGGDCPFLSITGSGGTNYAEAVAIYTWELSQWVIAVGRGQSDPRIVRDIHTWKPIKHLTHDYQLWLSPRETYCMWHLLPVLQSQIHNPEIRAVFAKFGNLDSANC